MTYQERYDQERQVLDIAADSAFIGHLTNTDGQTYGTVYDGNKLTDLQRQMLIHNDGQGRDVWDQVWFEYPATTPLQQTNQSTSK